MPQSQPQTKVSSLTPEMPLCPVAGEDKDPVQSAHFSQGGTVPSPLWLSRLSGRYRNRKEALAGGAQWIECWHAYQRGGILIPSQGICLGCQPGPQKGAHESKPHVDVSLPFSLPSPRSKK